jgi:hypothetical protein
MNKSGASKVSSNLFPYSTFRRSRCTSAFCRLQREKGVSAIQYRQLKSLLLADINDAAICDLTPEVIGGEGLDQANHLNWFDICPNNSRFQGLDGIFVCRRKCVVSRRRFSDGATG